TERKLFASGFATALIDRIGEIGENRNLFIDRIFTSPQAKTQVELALGPQAAKELEAFLRVENAMNLTKQALQGGSNTVQQLAAMGALGGITGGITGSGSLNPLTWNPASMGTGAGLMMIGR